MKNEFLNGKIPNTAFVLVTGICDSIRSKKILKAESRSTENSYSLRFEELYSRNSLNIQVVSSMMDGEEEWNISLFIMGEKISLALCDMIYLLNFLHNTYKIPFVQNGINRHLFMKRLMGEKTA